MLYFSKLKVIFIYVLIIFLSYFSFSNFLSQNYKLFDNKINLGLDLQGGSYLLLEIDSNPIVLQKLQNKFSDLKKFFREQNIKFQNIKIENNHYLGYPYDPVLYQMTNFSLIAETHFDGNQEFHPTEKTYRAIANMHPFIIASTPFFLNHLRNKGYKTFSNLINENYDIQQNHKFRLNNIMSSLSDATKTDYSWFKKDVEFNVNVLKNNAKNTLNIINNGLNNSKE